MKAAQVTRKQAVPVSNGARQQADAPEADALKAQQSLDFLLCGLFCFWKLWYYSQVMIGMIIAASPGLGECGNVDISEAEEYLTA